MIQRKQIPACEEVSQRQRLVTCGRERCLAAKTHPEETSEVTPVPRTGVEHVGRENAADYTDDVAIRKEMFSKYTT